MRQEEYERRTIIAERGRKGGISASENRKRSLSLISSDDDRRSTSSFIFTHSKTFIESRRTNSSTDASSSDNSKNNGGRPRRSLQGSEKRTTTTRRRELEFLNAFTLIAEEKKISVEFCLEAIAKRYGINRSNVEFEHHTTDADSCLLVKDRARISDNGWRMLTKLSNELVKFHSVRRRLLFWNERVVDDTHLSFLETKSDKGNSANDIISVDLKQLFHYLFRSKRLDLMKRSKIKYSYDAFKLNGFFELAKLIVT